MSLLNTIPKDKMTWGILHGDLVPPNIVFVDGAAHPIDFGACGFGFYLTDLAISFFYIHPHGRQQYIGLGLPGANEWLPTGAQKSASREFGR